MSFYFSTVGSPGRFGNHFFRNSYWSVVAEKFDLKIQYSFKNELNQIGLALYEGKKLKGGDEKLEITEKNMMDVLNMENIDKFTLYSGEFFAQTKEFCLYLREYWRKKGLFRNIPKIKDSVYVHLRLDDAVQFNPGENYYCKVLDYIRGTSGYISSDSPGHPLCLYIKERYPYLKWWQRSEVDTINKVCECENLILSSGTFSWLLGFMNTECPDVRIFFPKIYDFWHGDIFVYDDWREIDFKNI